jgi:hypothetical protein
MRFIVAAAATALMGFVLYFATIGYKHLFSEWPWHHFRSR